LGKAKGDNTYQGVIETSWTMELSKERANFFWSSVATSNFGGRFEIDGLEDAKTYQEHFSKKCPEMEFEIFDV
jgi:hypothetical protein